jgi:hypothetical protein
MGMTTLQSRTDTHRRRHHLIQAAHKQVFLLDKSRFLESHSPVKQVFARHGQCQSSCAVSTVYDTRGAQTQRSDGMGQPDEYHRCPSLSSEQLTEDAANRHLINPRPTVPQRAYTA